jgi:hypothetical protein
MLPDLTQYLWIAWLVLALVFVIIELLTLEFTFLMLAAGTLVGGLGVNLLGGPGGSRSSPPRPSPRCCSSRSGRCCCAPCIARAPQPTNVDACRARRAAHRPLRRRRRLGAPRQRRALVRDPSATSDAVVVGDRVVVTAVRGAMVEIAPEPTSLPTDRSTD